jgi:hypothetical protein
MSILSGFIVYLGIGLCFMVWVLLIEKTPDNELSLIKEPFDARNILDILGLIGLFVLTALLWPIGISRRLHEAGRR